MWKYFRAGVVAMFLLMTACSNSKKPSGPDDGVSLDGDVQPIFTSRCASAQCHGEAEASELRLTVGASHGQLVNVASVEAPTFMRVMPDEPDSSYLIMKLGDSPPSGGRMPLSAAPLSSGEVLIIRDWISGGAPNN
jgi:hypothetical protein